MAQQEIVDTLSMEWENGLSVLESMEPAFRDNLGPRDDVVAMYAKYNQKTLRIDPETTRRIDLIRLAPGYGDLTHAYHDSVEECLVLSGGCRLYGEDVFKNGDYFWRPPGWVHSAATEEGMLAVLSLQGKSPEDGSGPTTRNIRPAEDLGTNALAGHPYADDPPRGRVLRLSTDEMPWTSGGEYARGQLPLDGYDIERTSVKVLSANPKTGAQTLIMRLEPGYWQRGPGRRVSALEFYVISGALDIEGRTVGAGCYVYREGEAVLPGMSSVNGATLYMKVDGWMGYTPTQE